MEASISVIYSFRDRDPQRLIDSVLSLRRVSGQTFEPVVVDYGSSPAYCDKLVELCEKHSIKVVRTETEGLPWSRGAALNVGVRSVSTDFILTTDIDMCFDTDVLSAALDIYDDYSVLYCRPWWLPKSGNKTEARLGDFSQLGGFMFMSRDDFLKVGGFDERIMFWGREDYDFHERLLMHQITIKWLAEDQYMYHVWHPKSSGLFDMRPETSWYDSCYVVMENYVKSSTNHAFGVKLLVHDRPILKALLRERPFRMKIGFNRYVDDFFKLLSISKDHKFMEIDIGTRMKQGEFWISKFLVKIFRRIFAYCGISMTFSKNHNFDYFYISLPLLKKNHMKDYFISSDMSKIFFIFE